MVTNTIYIHVRLHIWAKVVFVFFLQQYRNMHFILKEKKRKKKGMKIQNMHEDITQNFPRQAKVLWTQGIHFTGTGDNFISSSSFHSYPLLSKSYSPSSSSLSLTQRASPSLKGGEFLHKTALVACSLKEHLTASSFALWRKLQKSGGCLLAWLWIRHVTELRCGKRHALGHTRINTFQDCDLCFGSLVTKALPGHHDAADELLGELFCCRKAHCTTRLFTHWRTELQRWQT